MNNKHVTFGSHVRQYYDIVQHYKWKTPDTFSSSWREKKNKRRIYCKLEQPSTTALDHAIFPEKNRCQGLLQIMHRQRLWIATTKKSTYCEDVDDDDGNGKWQATLASRSVKTVYPLRVASPGCLQRRNVVATHYTPPLLPFCYSSLELRI